MAEVLRWSHQTNLQWWELVGLLSHVYLELSLHLLTWVTSDWLTTFTIVLLVELWNLLNESKQRTSDHTLQEILVCISTVNHPLCAWHADAHTHWDCCRYIVMPVSSVCSARLLSLPTNCLTIKKLQYLVLAKNNQWSWMVSKLFSVHCTCSIISYLFPVNLCPSLIVILIT